MACPILPAKVVFFGNTYEIKGNTLGSTISRAAFIRQVHSARSACAMVSSTTACTSRCSESVRSSGCRRSSEQEQTTAISRFHSSSSRQTASNVVPRHAAPRRKSSSGMVSGWSSAQLRKRSCTAGCCSVAAVIANAKVVKTEDGWSRTPLPHRWSRRSRLLRKRSR